MENPAFSVMQVAIVRENISKQDDRFHMVFKSIPCSRQVVLFDTKRAHVKRLQMLTEDLLLAQLESGIENEPYWSLMNLKGQVLDMPKELHDVLYANKWCQLKV